MGTISSVLSSANSLTSTPVNASGTSNTTGSTDYFAGVSTYSQQLQQVISREVSIASLPVELLSNQQTTLSGQATELTTLDSDFASVQTAIQNISAEAGKDLSLLQSLYNEYQANPNITTLQKINGVLSTTTTNLPALLGAAHISDPVLAARITAGVNLILGTVQSFAALIPQTTVFTAKARAAQAVSVPKAKDLKKRWNEQVCAPTGNAALDSAFTTIALQ